MRCNHRCIRTPRMKSTVKRESWTELFDVRGKRWEKKKRDARCTMRLTMIKKRKIEEKRSTHHTDTRYRDTSTSTLLHIRGTWTRIPASTAGDGTQNRLERWWCLPFIFLMGGFTMCGVQFSWWSFFWRVDGSVCRSVRVYLSMSRTRWSWFLRGWFMIFFSDVRESRWRAFGFPRRFLPPKC